MTAKFIEITPHAMQAPRIENLDLDAPRSLGLLNRPQQAQRVGWEDPQSLLELECDYARCPIKAPGTHIFIPQNLAPSGAFQKIADYRHATSERYEHEWMYLVFDRTQVTAGQPVRLNSGKHMDECEEALIKGEGRVTANFLMVSSDNTTFYDGLRGFDAAKFVEAYPQWRREAQQDPDNIDTAELARLRNAFFNTLVYPAEGRNWPAGTITCSTGVTPHELRLASATGPRAFLHVTAYEDVSIVQEERSLRHSNPALAKAYFG